jgi:hypothetical protein
MDCYSIENPAVGDYCTDSELGLMVYNKDFGWIQSSQNDNLKANDGAWFSVKPGATADFGPLGKVSISPPQADFLTKYGVWIFGAGIAALAYFLMTGKKKK